MVFETTPRRVPPMLRLWLAFHRWRERRHLRQAREKAMAHLNGLPEYLRADVGIVVPERPDSKPITICDAIDHKHSLY
ncbi:hypothetical protein GOZ97_06360 [Agrobacterium vitis]|uniref:hypothetical protein n=1 Tax=Rhizobium/Agrobacterium group TaxID=227290 RepID=UPI0008DBFA79|nr:MULTISPECIES: hypothetical protein [Rhizobium/Agrobacterium group]MCF1434993.1 hypothetical protein [Allorhizobium ampelinum]MUO91624.1 hypothetical protein [Agrobacterium vitis]MUZ55183.1 hypothetical protein [Agrobacterium vitis]MUZ91038.1 hypothetical protein [Agrobacterium vitis]MVA42389.1 hypothetical protein [Agrobacterium vitis]